MVTDPKTYFVDNCFKLKIRQSLPRYCLVIEVIAVFYMALKTVFASLHNPEVAVLVLKIEEGNRKHGCINISYQLSSLMVGRNEIDMPFTKGYGNAIRKFEVDTLENVSFRPALVIGNLVT